ncbi:penicillin-binding protein activator [Ferrimonas pelagia]|uniref:penicillin-binding protein activator n=1 Tax=Ferrimonas pelagia TaxID=1177826 RepID=UPI0031EAF021
MKSHCSSFRLSARHWLSAALLCALAGCASGPEPQRTSPEVTIPLGQASNAPSYYLDQADRASGERRQTYLLLAARAYLQQGQMAPANALLDSLAASLPSQGTLQVEYRLLRARQALESAQRDDVLTWLDWPGHWALSPAQWRDAYALQIRLHQSTGDAIAQAHAHYALSPYLEPDYQQSNWDQIWRLLSAQPEELLRSAIDGSPDRVWRAWLELAWLAQHYAVQPATMLSELARWQRANPSHPAARKLPEDLERALNVQPYRPQQVAVLLPLSGQYASQARAIQDGLLANLLSQDSDRQVQFYDTQAMTVQQAYQQALEQGAEFVIGPLLKSNLDQLLTVYQHEVPLLALNQDDSHQRGADLYFFSLDPEAEAEQAAERMRYQGIKQPMVLASNTATGKRLAERFSQQWQSLTEDPVEIHYFQGNDDMRQSVQQAMHVDQSNARIDEIKRLFGNNTKADFRSRRDIDALYLVTTANEVRLLKPFVDVNLAVFADPLLLYASSRAHGELQNDQHAAELEGLRLSDMPWLLSDNAQQQQAAELWPERSLSLQRLYAMGYDSWSLIDRLAQMQVFTGYRMRGLSGQLTVDPDGNLERQLDWARYRRGALRPE